MKFSRWAPLGLLLMSFVMLLVLGPNEVRAESWWKVLGPVKEGGFAGGHVNQSKILSANQREVLASEYFEKWRTYEDDWVRLRLPDHPEVSLSIEDGNLGVKVEGGVMTTVDNSYRRAYTLKVGPVTYGVFLLHVADWFDDGICFCGPMVHHVYAMRDGCAVRYSLLPGGAVKKAQVLGGDGLRLMAFEWTHLGCSRAVYERLAEGMSLRRPHPWQEERIQAETVARYDFEGRAGWLHPGQTEADLRRVMGPPIAQDGVQWRWHGVVGDYPCMVTAQMRDGRLDRLTSNGLRRNKRPVVGSLMWALKFADADRVEEEEAGESGTDPFAEPEAEPDDSEAAPPAPPPTPEAVANALLALAPSVEGDRWRRWCKAVTLLADSRSYRHPELLQRVREQSAGRGCELDVLQAYGAEGIPAWVAAGLDSLAAKASDPETVRAPDLPDLFPDWWRADGDSLLQWQAAHDAGSLPRSVNRFMESAPDAWAETVLDHAEHLRPELGTALAVRLVRQASRTEDDSLAERLLDGLADIPLSDPAAVAAAVRELPEGEPGSDWYRQRREALESLGKRLRGT